MDITKLGSTTTSLCVLPPDAEQWAADPKLGDCEHHDHADEEHHRAIVALRSGEAANVHSWELVTAVDGPGTRMTLFLAGCPLRCQYCHNPDTMRVRGGTLTPLDEVMERIMRYRKIFQVTGGGVTISGGEPLMQPAFVQNVFTRCQELGIHTALDTSGFLGARATDELLQATSLVLLDVKSGLPETYKTVTARKLEPTLTFGDRLAALNKPVWIRFVLVPELTSAPDNVEAVARIVSRWSNVQRLEILPFHQMGQDKWAELGMEYRLADLKPPSPELIARVKAQLVQHGLPVFVG